MSQETIAESLLLFCDALENAVAVLKQELKKAGVRASENSFNALTWDASTGPKLGEYEIAYLDRNQPDAFQKVFNILKKVNANINKHYSPEGFVYFYWLYPEKYQNKIFRKKHSQPQESKSQKSGG